MQLPCLRGSLGLGRPLGRANGLRKRSTVYIGGPTQRAEASEAPGAFRGLLERETEAKEAEELGPEER